MIRIVKKIYRNCIRFIRQELWYRFRIRFDVDKRLRKQYKKCKWRDICCSNSYRCIAFIGCGPCPRCDHPCPACLFWTGYDLKYDIDNQCHKWVDNHFK